MADPRSGRGVSARRRPVPAAAGEDDVRRRLARHRVRGRPSRTSVPARVIVNDRADIARLAGADGVHVGQDDLPPPAVRALVGDAAELGLSTHTIEQIERAVLEPVSYVAVGPVFGTATKATGYEPIGLEIVREAAARTRRGGCRWSRSAASRSRTRVSVLDAGAASVAVISDLLAAGDPEARVRAFVERLSPYQRPRV